MDKHQRFQIIRSLILDSIWNSSISKFVGFLALAATLSGVTLKEFCNKDQLLEWINWSYSICVGLVILILRLLWVCAREINEIKCSKTHTFTPSKMAKMIRELVSNNNEHIIENKTLSDTLAVMCNKMRDCFDKLTNSHCCVSIKLIEGNTDGSFIMSIDEISNYKVHNVARDNNHGGRDSENYKNTEHFIRENTAFSTIIGSLRKSKRKFYLNNKVDLLNSYLTTSPYPIEDGHTAIPYKSELVFPIMKELDFNRFSFIGFLCVDSDIEKAFQTDGPGIEICTMMAQSLYWIFTTNKITPKNE